MTTNSDPALLPGNPVPIPQGIAPVNASSQYPTHYSDWAFGGLRTVDVTIAVADITARDAIVASLRYVGLTVVTTDTTPIAYYRLTGGITDSDWVQYKTQLTTFVGTARDSITEARRIEGMIAYVIDEDMYYRLLNGTSNSDWEEFNSGSQGAGLKEEIFSVTKWLPTPNVDPTMLTATITHSLDTTNLDVEWYQTGFDGAVFVPWKADSTDAKNKIIGCIPLGTFARDSMGVVTDTGNAFAGLVRITSSTSSGGGNITPTEDFVLPFDDTSWEAIVGTDMVKIDVVHSLSTIRPATEIYDNMGNEQLLEIAIETQQVVRLIIDKEDVFAGYVHIRG